MIVSNGANTVEKAKNRQALKAKNTHNDRSMNSKSYMGGAAGNSGGSISGGLVDDGTVQGGIIKHTYTMQTMGSP